MCHDHKQLSCPLLRACRRTQVKLGERLPGLAFKFQDGQGNLIDLLNSKWQCLATPGPEAECQPFVTNKHSVFQVGSLPEGELLDEDSLMPGPIEFETPEVGMDANRVHVKNLVIVPGNYKKLKTRRKCLDSNDKKSDKKQKKAAYKLHFQLRPSVTHEIVQLESDWFPVVLFPAGPANAMVTGGCAVERTTEVANGGTLPDFTIQLVDKWNIKTYPPKRERCTVEASCTGGIFTSKKGLKQARRAIT